MALASYSLLASVKRAAEGSCGVALLSTPRALHTKIYKHVQGWECGTQGLDTLLTSSRFR